MTCEELNDLLLEHHAGALPWHVALLLRTHAAFCDCCRHLVRTYGLTAELGAELREKEIPAEVAESIRSTLSGLPRRE